MNDSVTSLRNDVIDPHLLSVTLLVSTVSTVFNLTEKSVFERYTWTELLSIHGHATLQVRENGLRDEIVLKQLLPVSIY